MNTIMPIIVLLVLVIVISTVLYFARAVRKKADIESKYSLVYEEISGGSVHSINYSAPFVRHSIYDGLIVIAWLNTKLTVETGEVINAEIIKGVFSEGIRYKTKNHPISYDITIWIRSKSSVLNALEKVGINVSST